MAEVGTITEVRKITDQVSDILTGTGRRTAKFVVRVTTGATSDTLDISQYDADLAGIESIESVTLDGANDLGGATVWSGTTLTFGDHAGSGVTVVTLTGYYS